eukprot:gene46789-58347_t
MSPAAKKVVHGFQDLQKLRGMGLYEDLMALNAKVYSYWYRGTSGEGALAYLKGTLSVNPQVNWGPGIENDVQYWKDSRVFGDFYILFDREDGTVLLSLDYQKVYLVMGLANTIGEALRVPRKKPKLASIPLFHDTILGRKVSLSLLNWQGKIVYDGLMLHMAVMNGDQRNRAFRAYIKAVDNNTLITALERTLVAGNVPASSSSRAKTSGKVTAKPV